MLNIYCKCCEHLSERMYDALNHSGGTSGGGARAAEGRRAGGLRVPAGCSAGVLYQVFWEKTHDAEM